MTNSPNAFILAVKSALLGIGPDSKPEVVDDAAILVVDGDIADIGPREKVCTDHQDVAVETMPGAIAMPGLINAHHHTGLTPLQLGMPFRPLELWLPQFMGVRGIDPRLDTLYSAIEMLESGVTTVHNIQGGPYGSPESWSDVSDSIIAAYREIGMRVTYSFMIRDQNQLVYEDDETFLSRLSPDLADYYRPKLQASLPPIEEQMTFFEDTRVRWAEIAPDTVRLQLAPANLHWCSDNALQTIFETARRHDVKLHMHLDETKYQASYARARTGKSAVAHLADLGCLGPDLTIGHGIWIEDGDLDLLQEHQCCLCHNASSGLRLASGIAPINRAREKGLQIALGIDQCGINDDRDMLQEMRVAWMLHREPGLFANRPDTPEIFRMASEHGASTTGFEGRIGRLEVGHAADIVLIDWASIAEPYMDERTPLIDALVQRAKSRSVDKVYIGGRLVVDEGRVCKIDRGELMAEIRNALARPFSEEERRTRDMIERLMPEVERYYRSRENDGPDRSYRYSFMVD